MIYKEGLTMISYYSLCSTMACRSFEWIMNNDDNDIFGETWCAVDGYGMCYCCDCA